MIRNPIKIGVITANNGGVEHLPIPVGHGGTISQLVFMCYAGSTLTDPSSALASLTLEATHQNEGNFAILNQVTTEFLEYRERRHGLLTFVGGIEGTTPTVGILAFDPAVGIYKDEAIRNELTLGTSDLTDMTIRADFNADASSIDRIEVWMDVDYNLIQPLGKHIRVDKMTDSVTTNAGKVEITELPRMDSRYGYNAIHIENLGTPSDNISVEEVTIAINGQQYPYRDVPVDIINYLASTQGRYNDGAAPYFANFQTIDFGKEDLMQYFLPAGMNEFKVIPNFTKVGTHAGGSFDVWYELLRVA